MTPQEELVREVARDCRVFSAEATALRKTMSLRGAVADAIDGLTADLQAKGKCLLSYEDCIPLADAAIAIVVERCADICDQAAVEADEKLNQAETENSARNFASAHATSKVLAMAIKALAEEQA